ncbi:MAG: ABC transporter permease [Elusimicrobia bacterium]|nr:ABC transporter permease [Elusimicrobiota bacterium]
MRISELSRTAYLEIRAHKVRSALTGLSLAIGVAAILYTFSQTGGMKGRYLKFIELSGPGRIKIEKKRGYTSRGLSKGLTWSDARALRERFPELHMVYPIVRRWGTRMRLGDFKEDSVVIWATTDEYVKRDWVYTVTGRFFSRREVEEVARVCVVIEPGGWVEKPWWAKYFPVTPLEKLLKHKAVVGKQLTLEDHVFTVIGVLKEPPRDRDPRWFREGFGGSGNILVPITTYHYYLARKAGRWGGGDSVDQIHVDTGDSASVAATLERVKKLLTFRHRGEKDFDAKDYREIIAGALQRLRERALSILVIGIVAVLASGIGIMNVTLATIFSRIREIGIRRALGASRFDIIAQFVVEATALGAMGGAAGTGIGILLIKKLAPDPEFMAPIGPLYVGGALLIALGTGFLFSLYPAYQASRLDPVESLRYE